MAANIGAWMALLVPLALFCVAVARASVHELASMRATRDFERFESMRDSEDDEV